VLICDLATTFADLKDTIRALKHFQHTAVTELQKSVDFTSEQIENIKTAISESEVYRKAILENKRLVDFKRNHPAITLIRYKYLMNMIDRPDSTKKRKDIKLFGTEDSIPDENDAKPSSEEKEDKKSKEA
jgi:hypothetical protein